jgi:hypothetical protein
MCCAKLNPIYQPPETQKNYQKLHLLVAGDERLKKHKFKYEP